MSRGISRNNKKQLNPYSLRENTVPEIDDSEVSSGSDDYENSDNELDLKHFSRNEQTCNCKEKYVKIKKSSMKHVIVSKKSCWDIDELTMRRQKLEMQLSNSQLEESLNMERHHVLHMRFERVESIINALLLFLDCLDLQEKSSYRLCQQLNGLIVNEKSIVVTEELSQVVKGLCESANSNNSFIIQKKLRSVLDNSNDIDKLFAEYNEKKKDFQTASQNFKLLLQNANLNLPQLEKLQRQFDSILLNFQHSRCMLDQELPCIISNRIEILLNSFRTLGTDLEKIAADKTDLSSLLRHLESSLRNCNDLVAIKENLQGVSFTRDGAVGT